MTSELELSTIPSELGRRVKGLSYTPLADLDKWPEPNEGILTEHQRAQYLRRKTAVRLYLYGCSKDLLREKCNFSLNHIYRLITERCLQTHPDGLIYGWRGLIPNLHIKPYKRTKPIDIDLFGYGAVGALQSVLDLHPELRKSFEKRILASPHQNKLGATKTPRQAHCTWFLKELTKLGYKQRNQWPFNTLNNGYVSICNYINEVLSTNPKQAAKVLGGLELGRKLISGDGVDRPVDKIFQRVEMDAHKLDGIFCVMMPQISGGYIAKTVHRLWVIVIIDVYSRAVLGYYLSMGREVSKDDVMRTIKKALTRWRRRKLLFSDLAYMDEAALPSGVSEKYVGVCWDETSVDGSLAECCKTVEAVLADVVGSKLITPSSGFSSRHSLDDRPFIEAFFRTLGAYGLQRLTNTTGAKPEDKKGRNPEKVAYTSQFQIEYLEELLDVLITNYNSTPHTSLGYRSPLEYINFICSRPGEVLRYADPNSVQSILNFRKKCRVLGNLKEGRKPYVNFAGARYTNETLGQRFDLVGKYIWVINHLEDDARVAEALTVDGLQLGILRASPPWHKLPHSLRVRSAINSAIRKRKIVISNNADAVEMFLEFCEAQPGKKLPVHSAYLEVRRILEEQAQLNIGESVLENALSNVKMPTPSVSMPISEKQTDQESRKLPSRRMAASD